MNGCAARGGPAIDVRRPSGMQVTRLSLPLNRDVGHHRRIGE
jgi:hypothetical protein